MPEIEITIAVCTRNRDYRLESCLNSINAAIENQSKPVEIIIVDNGSTDNTAEVARDWAAMSRFPVQVLTESKPGLAAARNTAVGNARGDVIAFTDDDCTLAADYFVKLVQHYEQDNQLIVRGGRVELGDHRDLDFTTKRIPEVLRLCDIAEVAGFVMGCNMVIPRQVISQVGKFDERFGAGGLFRSAEETDFMCRAHRAGIPIEYVPDIVVFHHHGRRTLDSVKQLHFDYCVGKGAIYGKYLFSAPRLVRHLYWDVRDAFLEFFGGGLVSRELSLTHRAVLFGNFVGLILYGINRKK